MNKEKTRSTIALAVICVVLIVLSGFGVWAYARMDGVQKRITDLEAQNGQLEAQVTSLEAQVAGLEAEVENLTDIIEAMANITFTFMKIEELKITGITFPSTSTAVIACTNTGADTLTISSATIDDVAATTSDLPMDLTKGASDTITLTSFNWTSGSKYTFALLTTSGNKYTYTTTAAP